MKIMERKISVGRKKEDAQRELLSSYLWLVRKRGKSPFRRSAMISRQDIDSEKLEDLINRAKDLEGRME